MTTVPMLALAWARKAAMPDRFLSSRLSSRGRRWFSMVRRLPVSRGDPTAIGVFYRGLSSVFPTTDHLAP